MSPPRTGWKPARTPAVPEAHAFPSSRSIRILQRQCLDRRIATTELLKQEVAAWESQRNQSKIGATWKFTTADARIKLRRLYPSFLD